MNDSVTQDHYWYLSVIHNVGGLKIDESNILKYY